jgi:serine phosphatase RsbU (regulator of sigma subunit)
MSLISQLHTLESAGLVRVAQVAPDLEYLFRHSMVQDAAYASLLERDQRRLHLVVGDAIERLYPDRMDEMALSLALHYESAGQKDRAQQYYARAARVALASCANQEAEGHLHSALQLTQDRRTQAELYDLLGETLYRQGLYDQAIEAWRSGISIYRDMGELDQMARLYARAGRAAAPGSGNSAASLVITQQGLAEMEGAPDSVGLAMLIHEAGRAYLFNGMPEPAIPLCKRALAMAESLNAVEVQADTLATLGLLPNQPVQDTLKAFERAIELSEKAGLLQIAHRAHVNLGSRILNVFGDPYRAREHYQKAAELAVKRGALMEEFISRNAYASTTLDMGELDEAERLLPGLKLLLSQLTNPKAADWSLRVLEAWLTGYRGDWVTARDLMGKIRLEVNELGELLIQAEHNLMWVYTNLLYHRMHPIEDWSPVESAIQDVINVMGEGPTMLHHVALAAACQVYAHQGKLVEARSYLARLKEKSNPEEIFQSRIDLMVCEAELATAEGEYSRAISIYRELVDLHERVKGPLGRAFSLLDWAEVHLLRGNDEDIEQARQLLEQARDLCYAVHANLMATYLDTRLDVLMQSQTTSLRNVVRELSDAGKIQASFLPDHLPSLVGWDLAVDLKPARQTSGDFYDFILLPEGRLGIVVADVSDKGAGAALFMTLSRTVLRTYILQYPNDPVLALQEANARILADSHSGMFVTVFFGLLDPKSGRFNYVNAGHNPPLHFRRGDQTPFQVLTRSGMPLGVMDDAGWQMGEIELAAEDLLVIYTDGATDAQSATGDFFGLQRFQAAIAAAANQPDSASVLKAIDAAIHDFSGAAPRYDDIILLALRRQAVESSDS